MPDDVHPLPDIGEKMALLLGNYTHLASRIRHLQYDTTVCSDRIDVRCSYIALRDGVPTFDEFIEVVSEHTTAFCLPRSELIAASSAFDPLDPVNNSRIWTALANKARALFIKAQKGSNRSGEAGEIVLYILNEWILQAPQIVSKMYLKTNNNMPVHGTDGIHAKYDAASKKLYLFWGESKCHKTLASALSSALTSIKEFIGKSHEKREIEIVSQYIDLGTMDVEAKEAILSYLDPYSEQSNERVVVFSCLLVFDHEFVGSKDGDAESLEAEFVAEINEVAEAFISSIKETAGKLGMARARFEFFLFPVPSVQDFRDKFQSRIGWPK